MTLRRIGVSIVLAAALTCFGLTQTVAQNLTRPPDPPHPVSPKGADPSNKAPLGTDQLNSPFSVASTINQSWAGMFQIGTIRPPDPHGAGGPNGVLQTVNLRLAYYTKGGTIIWGPFSLSGSGGFWGSVGNTGTGDSDPRVLYDASVGRFYVIMQENPSGQSFLNLAVSKNSNPADTSNASWFKYRIENTETSGPNKFFGDYPGLGFDSQAVYVTYNMYNTVSQSFNNCQIIVLKKADIINGTSTANFVYTPGGSSNAFTLQPATVVGSTTPGNKAYFGEVSFASTSNIRVWALADPLGTRTLTSAVVVIPDNGGSSGVTGAPQGGTSTTVPTLAPRTQGNAFWRMGELWFCHTAGGGSGRSKAYYYRVNTNDYPTSSPTLNESGFIDGGTGVWTYQPSIGGNSNGDVCIVYTQSDASTFPTIMYTSRAGGAGSFEIPTVLHASPAFSNSDRWGDYASVTVDPTDNSFWITHEWSRSTAQHDWGTWWGNITPPVLPIQLLSFTGSVTSTQAVRLAWTTLTETNNYGFEIEKSQNDPGNYHPIPGSFVPGSGTTLVPHSYSYTDTGATSGQWFYRLKQIDRDGTIHYGDGIVVNTVTDVAEHSLPKEFRLRQNYPNPFNPSTVIEYDLPRSADVQLEIFNAVGQRVAVLVDERQQAGNHQVKFQDPGLASGVYFYRIHAGNFVESKKLILLR